VVNAIQKTKIRRTGRVAGRVALAYLMEFLFKMVILS
jgi:hypothetical protein